MDNLSSTLSSSHPLVDSVFLHSSVPLLICTTAIVTTQSQIALRGRRSRISGTAGEMVERSLPSRPLAAAAGTLTRPQSQRRSQRSATILPPPPPHDDMVSLQDLDEKSHPLPPLPPLPPSKSFYNTAHFSRARTISPTFLENFMSRHPRISRHRRRFAVLLFTSVTAVLLLIVLLAVILSRKSGNGHGGDGGSVGDGGDYGDGPTASADELAKHNAGIPRPPINHSNATGWTSSGHGDGTFYDPSVKNSAGQFQEGACEYPFINSVHDLIVALNKPDFGPFKIASQSPACGQCLQVTGPNGTVQVQVVDMCPECKSGSLDLSPGAFEKLAILDAGRVPISWERCT